MVGERQQAGSFGFLGLTGGVIEVEDFGLAAAPTGLDATDIGKVWVVADTPTAEDTWDNAGVGGMLARWSEGLGWQYLDPGQAGFSALIGVKVKLGAATSFGGALLYYSRAESAWWVEGEYYSETPYWTGGYTADGLKLLRVYVDCGALPNNTSKNVAHGLAPFLSAVDLEYKDAPRLSGGWFTNGTDVYDWGDAIPGLVSSARMSATNIILVTTFDASTYRGVAKVDFAEDPS